MDILRRNVGLTLFLAAALIVALVLGFFTHRHLAAAAEMKNKAEEQEKVWTGIQMDKIKVNDENLDVAKSNQTVARENLETLRQELFRRSFAPSKSYSGVECKNVLRAETRRMRETLERAGVAIGAVGEFSFDSVLSSEDLPDETTAVPMLTKQLEVVRELVGIIAESQVTDLNGFVREGGLNVAKYQYYDVIPFQVSVAGEMRFVKRLVSLLQANPRFFFRITHIELTADDSAMGSAGAYPTAGVGPTGGPANEGFGGRFRAGMAPGGWPMAPGTGRTAPVTGREGRPAEPGETPVKARVPTRDELTVPFKDMVNAVIKFDYVEYHDPNPTPTEAR